MSAINFVVRNVAGGVERGSVELGQAVPVVVVPGQAISLNLRPDQVLSYARDGADLKVTLADGSVVTVQGVFNGAGEQQADVYISANGELQRVSLTEGGDGALIPSYSGVQTFGKWSPDDDLFFVRGSDIQYADAEVIAPADDDVGMFATLPLLGALGGGGAAVAAGGAALLGAAALAGAGGDKGGAQPVVDPVPAPGKPGQPDPTPAQPAPTPGPSAPAPTQPDPAPSVAITQGVKSAGVMVNAADHADGSTVGGTGTPGAQVVVTANGASHSTTVGADGTWSVTFPQSELGGGTYQTGVTATITNGSGQTATATDVINFDTVTNISVALSNVEGDGVVNAGERADGVPLSGTSEAGATVVVTVNGNNYTTTAGANGAWSVTVNASDVPTGETTMPVSVKATDAYGNTATTSGAVAIDTITSTTVDDINVERGANDGAKGVVNAAERADGVPLAGTAEANASVVVTVNGQNYTTTANASGQWSVNINASDVPTGETTMPVSVASTDAAGNTATATGSVKIDTLVNKLTSNTVEGDDRINALEASDGVLLGGAVEGGSSVQVAFNGKTYTATVTGETWSLTVPSADAMGLQGTKTIQVTATDKAGNTTSISPTVAIDTIAPDVPDTVGVDDRGSHLQGVRMDAPDHQYSFAVADGSGSTTALPHDAVANHTSGERWYSFSGTGNVPDGSDLIVTDTDASGNTSSTFLVTNSAGVQNVTVNTAELSGQEIMKIDLDIADDSRLSLTKQQVQDLARTSDTLIIDGESDDAVTLTGASRGAGKTIDGRNYVEYDFGNDVVVWVDSDVSVTV